MPLLLLLLLLCAPVRAQAAATATAEVRVRLEPGELSVQLDGQPLELQAGRSGRSQELVGLTAPTMQIVDARGREKAGWSVTFQMTDLVGSRGGRIPASAMGYRPRPGRIEVVAGDSPPRETGQAGNLGAGVKALTTPDSRGTFRYAPAPESFRLEVPASAPSGDYRGRMTVTLSSGP